MPRCAVSGVSCMSSGWATGPDDIDLGTRTSQWVLSPYYLMFSSLNSVLLKADTQKYDLLICL